MRTHKGDWLSGNRLVQLGSPSAIGVVWAPQNIDPRPNNPELTTSEPYVMVSHATCSGAWANGPDDYAPSEHHELGNVICQPLENYRVGRNEIVAGTVSPGYLLPIHSLQRREKIIDESVGGISANYLTNGTATVTGPGDQSRVAHD